MIRTHKIRLEPNNVQDNYFLRASGTARHAYNWALDEWNREYKSEGKVNFNELKKRLRLDKNTNPQLIWYNEITKSAYENSWRDLNMAFQKFFKGESKYPKLKSRSKSKLSFRVDAGLYRARVSGFNVFIPKLGWVKMSEELRFQGKILDSPVSYTAGHWYISIPVELDEPITRTPSKEPVGIDVGVREYVMSDGTRSEVPRSYRKAEKSLRRAQQNLSRKAKDSKNREKAKLVVQKKYEKVANIRKDWLHKLTTELSKHEYVAIEDLNVAGMVKNRRLAKSISDASFGTFRSMLEYKTDIVVIDRFFPSSKLCNVCGVVRTKLPLNIRTWVCECGTTHDRDLNASINILGEAESALTACGEFLPLCATIDTSTSTKQELDKYARD